MFVTTNFSADGTKKIADAVGKNFTASIYAYNDFGGGTLAFYASPDNGNTLIALKNEAGTEITADADELFVVGLAGGQSNNQSGDQATETIWATLTGSTAPDITVKVNTNA